MSERNDAIRAFCLSMFGAMLLIAIKEIYYSFQSQECDEGDMAGRAMDKGAGEAPDKLLDKDKDKASDASSDEAADKEKEEDEAADKEGDGKADKAQDEAAEAAKKVKKFDVWAEHTEPPNTETVLTDGVMLGPCEEGVCPQTCAGSPVVDRAVEEPPLEVSTCVEGVCPFMTEPSVRSVEAVPYADTASPDDIPCGVSECQHRPQPLPCEEGVCPSGAEEAGSGEEQKACDAASACKMGVCPSGDEVGPCEPGVCPSGAEKSRAGDVASVRSEPVPCTDAVCLQRAEDLPCDVGVCPAPDAVVERAPPPDRTPCEDGVCPYRSETSHVEAAPLPADDAAPCTGAVCPHRTAHAPCDEAVCQHASQACLPEATPRMAEPVPCADTVCPRRTEDLDGVVCPQEPNVCPDAAEEEAVAPPPAEKGPCRDVCSKPPKVVVPCAENVCPLTDRLSLHAATVSPCEASCEDDPRLHECQENVCPHVSRPTQSSHATKPKEG